MPTVYKFWSLNLQEPQGPVQACSGEAFHQRPGTLGSYLDPYKNSFTFTIHICLSQSPLFLLFTHTPHTLLSTSSRHRRSNEQPTVHMFQCRLVRHKHYMNRMEMNPQKVMPLPVTKPTELPPALTATKRDQFLCVHKEQVDVQVTHQQLRHSLRGHPHALGNGALVPTDRLGELQSRFGSSTASSVTKQKTLTASNRKQTIWGCSSASKFHWLVRH